VAKRTPKPKANWRDEALRYLHAYQDKHVQAFCSLPDLYLNVVQKYGVSIGLFHDGLRELVQGGRMRLHPFSGPRSALERDEYALVMNREIMYYAEWLGPIS
jgi:hypothetical protein